MVKTPDGPRSQVEPRRFQTRFNAEALGCVTLGKKPVCPSVWWRQLGDNRILYEP